MKKNDAENSEEELIIEQKDQESEEEYDTSYLDYEDERNFPQEKSSNHLNLFFNKNQEDNEEELEKNESKNTNPSDNINSEENNIIIFIENKDDNENALEESDDKNGSLSNKESKRKITKCDENRVTLRVWGALSRQVFSVILVEHLPADSDDIIQKAKRVLFIEKDEDLSRVNYKAKHKKKIEKGFLNSEKLGEDLFNAIQVGLPLSEDTTTQILEFVNKKKHAIGNYDRAGHASLQTYRFEYGSKGCYMSYWPDRENELTDVGMLSPQRPHKLHTLDDDELNLGKKYKTYEFYSLDVKKINLEFRKFLDKNYDWNLYASSIFIKKDSSHNCISLVMYLLNAGGIGPLLKEYRYFAQRAATGIENNFIYRFMEASKADIFLATAVVILIIGVTGGLVRDMAAGTALIVRPGGFGEMAKFLEAKESEIYDIVSENGEKIPSIQAREKEKCFIM